VSPSPAWQWTMLPKFAGSPLQPCDRLQFRQVQLESVHHYLQLLRVDVAWFFKSQIHQSQHCTIDMRSALPTLQSLPSRCNLFNHFSTNALPHVLAFVTPPFLDQRSQETFGLNQMSTAIPVMVKFASASQPMPPQNSPPSPILQASPQPLSFLPQNESQRSPPDHIVPTDEHLSTSPPTRYSRSFSGLSQSSTDSNSSVTQKLGAPAAAKMNCNSSVNVWYGRHSNSWLFNNFSVTGHIKGMCHMRKNSRSCSSSQL